MVYVSETARGPLLAIGGAEDKFRDRAILRRFTELSGGDDSRIAIIPTASAIDERLIAAGEFDAVSSSIRSPVEVVERRNPPIDHRDILEYQFDSRSICIDPICRKRRR